MTIFPPISCLTAVPLVGSMAVLTIGGKNNKVARGLALSFTFFALAIVLILWHWFNPALGGLQFEEVHTWIPTLGVQYHVGIDGSGLVDATAFGDCYSDGDRRVVADSGECCTLFVAHFDA